MNMCEKTCDVFYTPEFRRFSCLTDLYKINEYKNSHRIPGSLFYLMNLADFCLIIKPYTCNLKSKKTDEQAEG